jgi:hypothetical protein
MEILKRFWNYKIQLPKSNKVSLAKFIDKINTIPLCRDCKFYVKGYSSASFSKCARPSSRNTVDPDDHGTLPYCDHERNGFSGPCGPKGKYFQPLIKKQ